MLKGNRNPDSNFSELLEHVRIAEVSMIAYRDAEQLLQEMYEDQDDKPIPPNWAVSDEILAVWTEAAFETKEITVEYAQVYINAFVFRFSQGYPNHIM